MINRGTEKTLAGYFLIGAPFISLFLLTANVSDPVNVTKLFALGGLAGAVGAVTLLQEFRDLWSSSKLLVTSLVLLILFSIFAVIGSAAPISQNLYGTYGRNTGFVTFFFLAFICLAAASLRSARSFQWILNGLFITGVVNILYCGWVILFGDFVGWSNPYGNILGTFGNPNFIGAFLGLFFSVYLAYGLGKESNKIFKYSMLLVLPMTLFEIIESHAIQGRVLAALGSGIVGFFYLRSRAKKLILMGYSILVVSAGIFAGAGALQIGPLSKYIYKTSVSLRGEYWAAAFRTGESHPLNGVGMDVFGDWYRRMRDAEAMITPGPNTVTNAAHNVVLDFFASGGWPLLLSYLATVLLGAIAMLKVARRNRKYDSIFVSLATAWVCYQVQSIISINQIGLALWGWVFTGALIGYEVSTRNSESTVDVTDGKNAKALVRKRVGNDSGVVSSSLIAGLGLVVGLIIAVPPLSSDMAWTSALRSQNLAKVEAALVPTYLHPQNSLRYAQIVQSLEQSKLPEIAHKYALIGVEFNPDYFEAWKSLYFATNATDEEKSRALENLKRLDPLNTDVTK
jgi:O-antigen ligase